MNSKRVLQSFERKEEKTIFSFGEFAFYRARVLERRQKTNRCNFLGGRRAAKNIRDGFSDARPFRQTQSAMDTGQSRD